MLASIVWFSFESSPRLVLPVAIPQIVASAGAINLFIVASCVYIAKLPLGFLLETR
jgi:hypothetical protein